MRDDYASCKTKLCNIEREKNGNEEHKESRKALPRLQKYFIDREIKCRASIIEIAFGNRFDPTKGSSHFS